MLELELALFFLVGQLFPIEYFVIIALFYAYYHLIMAWLLLRR